MSTEKNQQIGKKENGFSKSVLDALQALSIEQSVKSGGSKSIFKSAYNDKALRTKYRNALMKISKVEIENGKTIDVQKGLIPNFLLQIKQGNLAEAKKTFAEIKEICKKVYIAEDRFQSANDYFSSNRNESTQQILKTFIAVAQEFA